MAVQSIPEDHSVSLYTLAVALSASSETTDVVQHFMTWLTQALTPEAAALALVEEDGTYRVVTTHGVPPPDSSSFPDPPTFIHWFRRVISSHDTTGDVHQIPIQHENINLGYLLLLFGSKDTPGVPEELLQQATTLLATTLYRVQRCEQLRKEIRRTTTGEWPQRVLRVLDEQTLVGVYIFRDNVFVYVNRALAHMFGYTPEEIIGKLGPLDLTHSEDRPLVQENVQKRLQGKVPYTRYRFRGLRKDGTPIYLESYGYRVDYDGAPAIFGLIMDITDQVDIEEAYKALVEHSIQGLAILQDNRFVFVNRRLAQAVGYREEELLGMTFEEILSLVHPEDRQRMAQAAQEALSGQNTEFFYQFRYIHKDGDVRWAEVRGSRVLFRRRPALQLAFLNITPLKEAEARLQRQLKYLRTLKEIFSRANQAQSVKEALESALDMTLDALELDMGGMWLLDTGDSSSHLTVSPLAVVRGVSHARGRELLASLRTLLPADIWEERDVWVVEDWFNPPPELQPVAAIMQQLGVRASIAVPVLSQGRRIGGLVVVCRRKRAWLDEEIHFVQMVGQETGTVVERVDLLHRLRVANEELRRALQAREEMVQNVSHELRTPLTVIRGYLELLLEGILGPLQKEQVDALNAMLESTERLQFMIDRLILLRTLDSYQPEPMSLDMQAWLQALLEEWRPRAQKSGHELILEVQGPLPLMRTDPLLLEEVMKNMLDNAIKFSPDGGEVRVKAWPENGHIHIAISDQGIGIPKEELERIFDYFYQVDKGTTRHFEGMGIGLTVVHHIVNLLGGRVWAESEGRNRGSTFHVLLPVDVDMAAKNRKNTNDTNHSLSQR